MKINILAVMILILLFNLNLSGQSKDHWDSFKTKNFTVKYEKGVNKSEAKLIGDDLEYYYNEWNKKLRIKRVVKGKYEVRIYNSEKKFIHGSKTLLGDLTAYDDGIIHLSPPSLLDKSGNRVFILTKAAVLAMLSSANANGCPVWLSEAFGLYAGDQLDKYGTPPFIRSEVIRDFNQEYAQARKKSELQLLYSKLSEFMKFLLQRYGTGKVELVFRAYDGMKTDEQVFEEVFGEKYSDIEKAWGEAIKNLKRD